MEKQGRILSLSGGHYTVLADGMRCLCTARGSFRRREDAPITGDLVTVLPDRDDPSVGVITAVIQRKNALVRPPLANLDVLFVAVSMKAPRDDPANLDKLSVIAENRGIETALPEELQFEKKSHNGSLVTVTATFGLTLTSLVIQNLLTTDCR